MFRSGRPAWLEMQILLLLLLAAVDDAALARPADGTGVVTLPELRSMDEGTTTQTSRFQTSAADQCSLLTTFDITQDYCTILTDSASRTTDIYVGAPGLNSVLRFRVDSTLARDIDTLPIPYGTVWAARDLDRDGALDLVLQRGDGSNGFLDIVSTTTWSTLQRFTFPGMNIVFHAQCYDFTGDGFPEIYLSPGALSGGSLLMVIGFDPVADSFLVLSQVFSPEWSYRMAAIADFDQDGRPEIVQGNDAAAGLYEWRDSSIVYIGALVTSGQPVSCVRACVPKPGGVIYLMIGYAISVSPNVWQVTLFEPYADNAFRVDTVLPASRLPRVGAVDSDCDGLDELIMRLDDYELWEWESGATGLALKCVWSSASAGTLADWRGADINWDGALDWIDVNPNFEIWALLGGPCLSCAQQGICTPPPTECLCVCHADPNCDGVLCDVLDVVKTVDVAFRGAVEQHDSGPVCWAKQTDADCDGSTNIVDVVRIINVAFRGASAGAELCDPCVITR